jgi:hypothetical protein
VIDDSPHPGRSKEIAEEFGFEHLGTGVKRVGFQGNGPDLWRCPSWAFNAGYQKVKSWHPDVIILTCAEMFHLDHDALAQMTHAVCNDGMSMVSPDGRDDLQAVFAEFIKGYGNIEKVDQLDGMFTNLGKLNVTLPFCLALRAEKYEEIGGYDEGFQGIAYDDDDLVWRFRKAGLTFKPTSTRMVHLFHSRNHGGPALDKTEYMRLMNVNRELYLQRREYIIRNVGVEWGRG